MGKTSVAIQGPLGPKYLEQVISTRTTLIKTEISKINQSHKKFLKQFMHLPDRTADAAIYILSGQIPIEGKIHKRTLGTLGGILRSDSVERRLAERQILVKDEKSKSWFVYVNKVLRQYGLPSTMDLLDVSYTKAQWRHVCAGC